MKLAVRLAILLSFGLAPGIAGPLLLHQTKAASPPTAAQVLQQIQAKAQTLKSLRTRFVQRQFSRLLVTSLESEGHLFWQPPDRLRWEVVRPDPVTLVARSDKILVLYSDLKKATFFRQPLGGGLLERITGATDDPEGFERQYRIEITLVPRPGGDRWLLMAMEPKSARRARYFKRVEVKIDPSTWLPQEIAILESDEDWTVIYLSDMVENTDLPDGLFTTDPPEGFRVERLRGGGGS